MEAELNSLDDRIQQLIRVAERLRAENGELRQQLATSLNEGKQLRDRMTAARLRLEGVLTRLPQDNEQP
jgi:cell division protein ZapB